MGAATRARKLNWTPKMLIKEYSDPANAQNIVVDRLKGLNKNLMAAEPLRMQAESRYLTAKAIIDAGVAVETIPGVQESPASSPSSRNWRNSSNSIRTCATGSERNTSKSKA